MRIWETFLQGFNRKSMFLPAGGQSAESLHLVWQVGKDGCKFSYGQLAFKATWPRLWLTEEFRDMRHLFPLVMAFQAFGKDLSNRRVRIGLESKKLVECVNNQTSKDPGLRELIRPLVLLLPLNNIQLRAQLYESKSSEESLFFFPLQGQQEDWDTGFQVQRTEGQAFTPDSQPG